MLPSAEILTNKRIKASDKSIPFELLFNAPHINLYLLLVVARYLASKSSNLFVSLLNPNKPCLSVTITSTTLDFIWYSSL